MAKQKNDIFTILEIEPTNDFKTVKRAYTSKALKTHPDKHSEAEKEAKTLEFQSLVNEYELVNSEEKLNRYYEAYNLGNFSSVFQKIPSNNSNGAFFPDKSGNGLYVPNEGIISIFIPVPVSVPTHDFFTQDHHSLVFNLPRPTTTNKERDKVFAEHFDFRLLAEVLKNRSKAFLMQVGMTDDEAVEIVNLHKHHQYTIIVETKVSLTRLSDSRSSEKEMFGPNLLGAREGNYFFLIQNSEFGVEDIISARAMTFNEYLNSRAFGYQTKIGEVWTEGTTILNKEAYAQLEYYNGSNNPSLSISQNPCTEIEQGHLHANTDAALVLTSSKSAAIKPNRKNICIPLNQNIKDTQNFMAEREQFDGFFKDKNEEWRKLGKEILDILDNEYNTPEKISEGRRHLLMLNNAINDAGQIKQLFEHAENEVQGHPSLAMKLWGIGLFLLGVFVAAMGGLVLASSFISILSGVLAMPGATGIAVGATGIGVGIGIMGSGLTLFGFGCQQGLSKKMDAFVDLLEEQPLVPDSQMI